jgi:hypothetical protein
MRIERRQVIGRQLCQMTATASLINRTGHCQKLMVHRPVVASKRLSLGAE